MYDLNYEYTPKENQKLKSKFLKCMAFDAGACIGLIFSICFCLFILFILIFIKKKVNEQDDYTMNIYESYTTTTTSGSGFYE